MNALDEHAIRLSQAGEPYDEEEQSVPLWRGMVPLIIVAWVLFVGAGYCVYRALEALPS
jgi:hypothetical protein